MNEHATGAVFSLWYSRTLSGEALMCVPRSVVEIDGQQVGLPPVRAGSALLTAGDGAGTGGDTGP